MHVVHWKPHDRVQCCMVHGLGCTDGMGKPSGTQGISRFCSLVLCCVRLVLHVCIWCSRFCRQSTEGDVAFMSGPGICPGHRESALKVRDLAVESTPTTL